MSILLIISTAFVSLSILGGLVGYFSNRETDSQSQAAKTWRDITHRGGVTAVSPWHAASSNYNAPGLVQIYPNSQQPSSTPSADPNVRTERPSATSVGNPVDEGNSTISETVELPLELSDEPNEIEKEAVLNQLEEGLSQSKIILAVWGVKSGGSAKYKTARERFQHYRAEAQTDV